jgi:hypothetical protein
MGSMSRYMSDLTVGESGRVTSESHSDWKGETDTPGLLGAFFGGADVEVGGSHNAHSNRDFAYELRRHAEGSTERSVEATRTASSVSIGEVSTHHHAEGESETHLEATSRTFSNPNTCHAVTYLFYRINKPQVITFKITSIERRVVDVAAPSRVVERPLGVTSKLAILPDGVRASAGDRLDVEERERESVQHRLSGTPYTLAAMPIAARFNAAASSTQTAVPLTATIRRDALNAVDDDLDRAGLIDKKTGEMTADARRELELTVETSLPTPGIYVRGCIDECATCEPALMEKIRLDLERRRLENRMLERQIELLDQAQEYRCCPGDGDDDDNDE